MINKKIFGITLVPLNEPLELRLQCLAAGSWFLSCTIMGVILFLINLLLLITNFWWISILTSCWIYLDRNTSETGGRPSEWVQSWALWKYMRNYFNAKLVIDPECNLDPKKNYIFCCFPHGVLPAGPFCNLSMKCSDFRKLYPQFQVKITALRQLFWLPITREIGLGLGGISCSAKSLEFLLSKPSGGYALNLFPGGAAESIYAKPGPYVFVVKNRKGFVKIALKTGAPLVPVITFGELHAFDQIQNSIFITFQNAVKHYFGFMPLLLKGRGLFQTSFGIFPRKTQLTTILGKPISVTKVSNPTNEEIDEIHDIFVDSLRSLFDKYKDCYLQNSEEKILKLI